MRRTILVVTWKVKLRRKLECYQEKLMMTHLFDLDAGCLVQPHLASCREVLLGKEQHNYSREACLWWW